MLFQASPSTVHWIWGGGERWAFSFIHLIALGCTCLIWHHYSPTMNSAAACFPLSNNTLAVTLMTVMKTRSDLQKMAYDHSDRKKEREGHKFNNSCQFSSTFWSSTVTCPINLSNLLVESLASFPSPLAWLPIAFLHCKWLEAGQQGYQVHHTVTAICVVSVCCLSGPKISIF